MDNNIKTNDWFAARFLNEDVGIGTLLGDNITPSTATLYPIEFYQNKPKVQEKFQKEDGTFDEKSYKEFYNNIASEYLELSSIDSLDFMFNEYERNPNVFSIKNGREVKSTPVFSYVDNPLKQTEGVSGFNQWSDPKISNREAAQMNRYYDNDKGEWSNETLNEAGWWGLLTGKSLVYATYDEDEYDDEGNLIHSKGEWKKDEWGNYYAETAENKEMLDKEFVNISEVLTDDNSAWNSIDIFDSDDINSNAWKTGLRTAAVIGSTFIPYANIGTMIKYGTAALEFAKVLPQLTKTLNGLFSKDEFDSLNRWDNIMKRFSKSNSDEARNNTFRLENLFDLVQSSFMQLAQQRAIARIPQNLGLTKEAELAASKTKTIQWIANKANGFKYGDEMVDALTKASPVYREAMKTIDKYSKVSHAISMAHIIATSGGNAFNEARSHGFDNFSSSVISLATLGFYGGLFQTDYGRALLTGSTSAEEAKRIKTILKNYLKNNASKMSSDQKIMAPDSFFKKWGKKFKEYIQNHYEDAVNGNLGIVGGAINEGLEELTEELTADVAIQLGKGINQVRESFTGKEYSDNYSYLGTDPFKRYLMALGGGAIGGAVFKVSDILQMGRSSYSEMKKLLKDDKHLEKEILTLISQGKKDDLLNVLDGLQKTKFANTNIDAVTGEAVSDESMSQNAILFSTLRKGIESIDLFLNNNGLKVEYDDFEDIELMKGLRVAYLKDSIGRNGVHKSMFNDYISRMQELNELNALKVDLTTRLTEKNNESVNLDIQSEINNINKIIELKKQEVYDLLDGKDDSYIGRLMLESNPNIMNSIIPIDKESISKNMYNMSYNDLPKFLQEKIDARINSQKESGETELNYMSAWKSYKSLASDDSIKTELQNAAEEMKDRFMPNISFIKNGEYVYNNIDPNNVSKEWKYNITKDMLTSLLNNRTFKENLKHIYGNDSVFNEQYDKLFENLDYITSLLLGEENSYTIYDKNDNNLDLINYLSLALSSADSEGKTPTMSYIQQLKGEISRIKEKISNKEGLSDIEKYYYNVFKDSDTIDTIFSSFTFKDIDIYEQLPVSNSANLYKVVDIMYKYLYGKDISYYNIIQNEKNKIKTLGDKYSIDDDIKAIFENVKNILKENGLLYSLIIGSEDSYNREINSIPFGANNYLNIAFKEKGIDSELLILDNKGVNDLVSLLTLTSNEINDILEAENIAKGNIVNTHKKLGINYMSVRLQSLKSFIGYMQSTLSGDLLDSFNNAFSEYTISDDDYSFNENGNDDDYINSAVSIRNKTIDFENRWYTFFSSISLADRKKLISSIRKYIPKYEEDVSTVNSNINKDLLFSDSSLYNYLASRSLCEPTQLSQYRKYLDATDNCPFDTQEEITIDILNFFNAETIDHLEDWFDTDDSDFKGMSRFYKLDSSGGIGKSKGIINAVKSILGFENKEKFIKFAANNSDQLNSLTSETRNRYTIENIKSMIRNEDEFKKNFENTLLIIDECSHLNVDELRILNILSRKFNTRIVLSGDTKQSGASENFDLAFCLSSFRLDEQLRALSDISVHNAKILGELDGSNRSGIFAFNPGNKTFKYYISNNGLEGIITDGSIKDITLLNINNIISKYNIPEGSSIAIYAQGDIDSNLLSENPINGYNIKVTNNVADIQGLEYDYVVTNFDGNITEVNSSLLDAHKKYKDAYTILTRCKHGVIMANDLHFNIKGNQYSTTCKLSESKPVYSNIVSDDIVKSYKDFKKAVFDELIIPNYSPVVNEDANNTEEDIEIDSVEIPNLSGYGTVEFATSFIPKKDLEGLNDEQIKEYLKSRAESIEKLYLGEKLLLDKLYLVKEKGIGSDDVYNLADIDEYKDLKKDDYHFWIKLEMPNGKYMTIGMFQNLGIGQYSGFEDSEAHNEILKLLNSDVNMIPMKDWNIVLHRTDSPIAIKRTVDKSMHTNLTIKNGEVSLGYSWIQASPVVYFDPISSSKDVPMAKINDSIKEIESLYKSIYEELKNSDLLKLSDGKYLPIVKDLMQILGYDITTVKKTKNIKFRAKGMPHLYHKFISFVSPYQLDNNGEDLLKQSSQIYLSQLKDKITNLSEILTIVKNKSGDWVEDVSEILNKQSLWKVNVIAWDYDIISNKKELTNVISRLNKDKYNKGGVEYDIISYNISIINQLGDVFSDLAIIYDNANKIKNNIRSEAESKSGFVTKEHVDSIVKWFNDHENELITAYKDFNGINEDVSMQQVIDWLIDYAILRYADKTMKMHSKENGAIVESLEPRYYFKSDDRSYVFFMNVSNMIYDLYFDEDGNQTYLSKTLSSINTLRGYSRLKSIKEIKCMSGMSRNGLIKNNEMILNLGTSEYNVSDGSFTLNGDAVQPATMRMTVNKNSIQKPKASIKRNDKPVNNIPNKEDIIVEQEQVPTVTQQDIPDVIKNIISIDNVDENKKGSIGDLISLYKDNANDNLWNDFYNSLKNNEEFIAEDEDQLELFERVKDIFKNLFPNKNVNNC